MTRPLALICYERLFPGSQVVIRLQDLGYRVQHLPDARGLPSIAEQARPLLVLADFEMAGVSEAIAQLKQSPATKHLPVLAFTAVERETTHAAARVAGATIVVSATGLLPQLKELLDQALEVE